MSKIPGEENPADVGTKIHPVAHLEHLKELLNIRKVSNVEASDVDESIAAFDEELLFEDAHSDDDETLLAAW